MKAVEHAQVSPTSVPPPTAANLLHPVRHTGTSSRRFHHEISVLQSILPTSSVPADFADPLFCPRLDDEIFEHTMAEFPELSEEPYEKVTKLDEEWLKSAEGKERWRKFINTYVIVVSLLCLPSPFTHLGL